jgi:tetratricopeptide (TPR) repeat protein
MPKSMRFFLTLCFLINSQLTFSQTDRIDFFTKKFQSFRLDRIDSMNYYAGKLKEFAKKSDSKKALIRYYNALGIIEEEQGYYENAMLRYDSALYYALSIADSLEIGRVYQLRGVVYREQGKYDQAIDYLIKASRIAYTHHDPEFQALCYMNLSSLFNFSKDYTSAKKYAQQSIELGKNSPSQFSSTGGAYIELGNFYTQNSILDSAAMAYENAKAFFKQSSISDGISTAANNLGVIYYYQGNYQKAIDNFMETYAQAHKANDRKNMALGLMNAGDTYTAMGRYDNAEDYLNRSLDIFKEVGNRIYLRDVYEYLTSLKTKKGDYKSALHFNQLAALYKDSLFNENMATKIANIQTQYETEKKDREIKLLELEAKAKQQQMIYLVIVFIFLILAIVLFFGR